MTQGALAPRVGMTINRLSQVEQGKVWPTPVEIGLIIEATSHMPGQPAVTMQDLYETWHAAHPGELESARDAATVG